MKYLIITYCLFTAYAFSQSIRKSHYEMGLIERKEYNNVMRKLYANGTATLFANTHINHTYARHESNDFLPWHRIFIHYFEKSAQVQNKYINLPYFGFYTTTANDTDIAFSSGSDRNGLLGYPISWSFTRMFNILSANQSYLINQPSTSPLSSVFLNTTMNSFFYKDFRLLLEVGQEPDLFQDIVGFRGIHDIYHRWIGGYTQAGNPPTRATMWDVDNSPKDPVFYFHHGLVDFLWNKWLSINWNGTDYAENDSKFPSVTNTASNSVIGYPLYNPRTVFDSRSMKLWYAEDGKVVLDKYTASHQTLGLTTGPEFYFYTGLITVAGSMANFFTVPAGIEAKIESLSEIAILPGFSAPDGSYFGASSIGAFPTSSGFDTFRKEASESEQTQLSTQLNELQIFPNPNSGSFTVALPKDEYVFSMFVTDAKGSNITYTRETDFEISLSQASKGIYTVLIQSQSGKKYKGRVVVSF